MRVITINDVYKLDNYPRVASAVKLARSASSTQNCVVTSHLNGDYFSPCILSALDGGKAMMQGINHALIDYLCIGNHEFDLGAKQLRRNLKAFNGKTINSNVEEEAMRDLPRYDVINIGSRKAVIAGVCTDNKSIYTPPMPAVKPVTESLVSAWMEAQNGTGKGASLFLPMTHQFVAEDKMTAEEIALRHSDIAACMPVILGGHEHSIIVENAGKSKIVKMGEDATHIGIVDIWWTASGELKSSLKQMEATAFSEEPKAEAFARKHQEHLQGIMSKPLFSLDEPMSSKQVRSGESTIASKLLGLVRQGLADEGVEVVLLNAGNIRGKKDYEAGNFLIGDLYSEHPWDNEMAIVSLPGLVLRDCIRASRSGAREMPCFLHADPSTKVSKEHELLEINGEPVEDERLYTVAILVHLLNGMDSIEPLVRHVDGGKGLQVPDEETCRPTKVVILKFCMMDSWRRLLGITSWASHANILNDDEIERKAQQAFEALDSNRNGTVDREECMAFLKSKDVPLVEMMFSSIDMDQDGLVSFEEIKHICF